MSKKEESGERMEIEELRRRMLKNIPFSYFCTIFLVLLLLNVTIFLFPIIGERVPLKGEGPSSFASGGRTGGDELSIYNGLYYLHDDLPEHGQNTGNTHDVGNLLREQPHGNEERYCAKWVQYDFDEHVLGEETGNESYTLDRIYFHIWWRSANKNATIGTDVHGLYDSATDYSIKQSFGDAVSIIEQNGYWLTTGILDVGYSGKDIHDLTVKVASIDAIPSVYTAEDQYSFIILNPEEDEQLRINDQDSDGLSDYDELFIYFSNPYDLDTDNDKLDDLEEVTEGKDGFITDPNNYDQDNDDLLDGDDFDPMNTCFRIIDEEWVIESEEILSRDKIELKNDIIVKNGASLTVDNCVIKMNQDGEQFQIRVEEGGELIIRNSTLIADDPDHWYTKALDTEHWHDERSIEIYGTARIQDNRFDYGSMIYLRSSNDSVIERNEISHFYYGIFCSYSTPEIKDNVINPFVGNGIFLWYSDARLTGNEITTYIGTGISCYYSSPIIKDCQINSGSNDFFLSGDSHPLVSNTEFNKSRVHIDDNSSSILIGSFNGPSPTQDEEIGEEGSSGTDLLIVFIVVGSILVCIIAFFVFFKVTTPKESDQDPKVESRSRKKERRNIKVHRFYRNKRKKR